MIRSQKTTPHAGRLLYLEGWRGVAVLAVLLGHFFPILYWNTGRLGVELFFVLSGRLMADILFVERFPLGRFIYRRISRVWPALWVFVAIIGVIEIAIGDTGFRLSDLLASVTFTVNYVYVYSGLVVPLQHLWSLAIEEWSYAILAGVAIFTRSRSRVVWILAALSALAMLNGAFQMAHGGSDHDTYWRTDVRVSSILLPAAIRLLLRDRAVNPVVTFAALAVGTMLSLNFFPAVMRYTFGTAALAVAVSTIDNGPKLFIAPLSSKPLRMIGAWSFSLYLWQQPFYAALPWLWQRIGFIAPMVALACVLAISIASYRFVENPARRWLNSRSV